MSSTFASSRAVVRSLLALSLVACPASLVACGGTPAPENDAAVTPDTGLIGTDGGRDAATTPDAGRDAASSEEDAAVEEDAAIEEDAAVIDDAWTAPVTECTTTITATDAGMFVQLCEIDGTVEHVRITGLAVPAVHASGQIVFGFDAAPSSATVALEADQFRFLLYGGGPPSQPALAQVVRGTEEVTLGTAAFLAATTTVCADLHDGAVDAPPYAVMWVDGQNGADCEDSTTLTLESAYASELVWSGPAAVNKATPTFYRQAASVTTFPTITLFDAPVLAAADLEASTLTCETTTVATTDWQPLCTPAAGVAQHIRIEDVSATANSSYAYLVLGASAGATGAPAVAPNRMILTMGRNHTGASWTYFRYGDVAGANSTTQFVYATDAAAALYTAAPTTVCLDVGEVDGHARVAFWATGANAADCDDWSTLTLTNALYDSSTDAATGSIWSGLVARDLVDYVKASNATATFGDVVVFREAAAL